MKSTFFLLLALIALTVSCSKDDSDNTGNLTGTWQWVRTDGGFNFHIHETPASTGKNIELTFNATGRYTIFTNGQETSRGSFTIKETTSIHTGREAKLIDFSQVNDADLMIGMLTKDSLELSDNMADGVGSLYVKRKN